MAGKRNVTIGRDAIGNVIITGGGNEVYVMYGVSELPPEVTSALKSRRLKPGEVDGAVPLPTLELRIEFTSDERREWRIQSLRAFGTMPAPPRTSPVPWQQENGFAHALADFWRLSREMLETPEKEELLHRHATTLGDALARVLAEEERRLLTAAAQDDPPPPLLVIESADDLILALPWELVRLDEEFSVREGRLDVARCVPADGVPTLDQPSEPVRLLINVSAPEGSKLNYEEESYFITRAMHDHVGVVVNEMGEVDDLLESLRQDPSPLGVHFSGHGEPGCLLFEDEYGEGKTVRVDELLARARKAGSQRLPRFFFLACCHGGDAPSLLQPSASSLAQSV